ncbi:hypothetical protein, partial [Yersinia nurmii]|uniref:hypothetical protein n=1 Tax=Yersinia nurmii TaxID=685706 RepID=UPI00066FE8BA
ASGLFIKLVRLFELKALTPTGPSQATFKADETKYLANSDIVQKSLLPLGIILLLILSTTSHGIV